MGASPFGTFSGPFAELATLVGLGWLATILYIDAVVSPGGTGLIYTTGASRVSYGLSRNGYIPSAYEKTNARGVPWVGWPPRSWSAACASCRSRAGGRLSA